MEVFKDYAYYYNAFYGDKDYKGEAEKIDFLIKKYGKNVKHILDFGCGTGRHDLELFDLGYQCEGVDLSETMIEIARENSAVSGKQIEFSVADIRAYKAEKKYDAVISLFHVMSYQNSNEDVLRTLASARKCLDKDGIFIFDAWYGPGVLSDRPAVRVKEIEEGNDRFIRIAKPVMHEEQNIVDVSYEILVIDKKTGKTKVIQELHKMRYFFRPEIEFLLQEADFELVDNLDCQTLGTTSFDSWTSYFIARAR